MSFNIIQEAKTKALKSIDFPADSDKAAKDLVIVFEGEMFIKKDGDYTFTLDSNAVSRPHLETEHCKRDFR